MSRRLSFQTGFAAGELDPRLAGRFDLRARREGARRIRNLVPAATGGVRRRPGTRHLADLPGILRILPFPRRAGDRLVALGPGGLEVRLPDGGLEIAIPFAGFDDARIAALDFTVWNDELLLVHPELEPRRLRHDPPFGWVFETWPFRRADPADPLSRPFVPFERIAPSDVRLGLSNVQQVASAPASWTFTVTATAPVFTVDHVDTWLRIAGIHARIFNVIGPTRVEAESFDDPAGLVYTLDWAEQAFSPARGWPATVAVHQNRLVVGGTRDLPDFVWLSRSGRPFDFDVGTGLDDEAVAFRLAGEEREVVRHLVAGRRLFVFTSAGEWVVHGDPITPTRVEVVRQTRIGSPDDRRARPVEVDGAVLFVGRGGRDLREFVYTDTEQAWQAADLAMLAGHLVTDPRALAFDPVGRRLWLVRGDGTLASLTVDRNANVVAWASHDTDGTVRDAVVLDARVHLLVERAGTPALEVLDDGLGLDGAVVYTADPPTATWTGLDRWIGRTVQILADGEPLGPVTLQAGTLVLPRPASELVVGYGFTHELVPFAPVDAGAGIAADRPWRPVRITFRLLATHRLTVDLGRGPVDAALPAVPHDGDVSLRALGWRRGEDPPAWRLVQDDPRPFTLLSVTLEVEV